MSAYNPSVRPTNGSILTSDHIKLLTYVITCRPADNHHLVLQCFDAGRFAQKENEKLSPNVTYYHVLCVRRDVKPYTVCSITLLILLQNVT